MLDAARAADAASSAVAHETIVRRAQVDVARARQEFSESKSKALQEQSRTHNDLVSELEQAHDKARLADARRRSEISRGSGKKRERIWQRPRRHSIKCRARCRGGTSTSTMRETADERRKLY